MKNLWRIFVLFILPGMVLGGYTVTAFWKFFENSFQGIISLGLGGVLWSFSAYIAMLFAGRIRRIAHTYYPAMAIMAAAFPLIYGWMKLCGVTVWLIGGAGIILSALFSALVTQIFTVRTYRRFECRIFSLGVLAGGGLWLWIIWSRRVAWGELYVFCLALFMLICWLYASPLTRRGSGKRRWLWRLALFVLAVSAYSIPPVFQPKAWNPSPAGFDNWMNSDMRVTVQGCYFEWINKDNNSGFFNSSGRLITHGKVDEELQPAMLPLLAILGTDSPAGRLVTPLESVLPPFLVKAAGKKMSRCQVPTAMEITRQGRGALKSSLLFKGTVPQKNCDLLLITALPENQYPGVITRFMQYHCAALKNDGVAAVPGNLLKNQVFFHFMYEKFSHYEVLPFPGDLWVFSNRKLDLSSRNIAEGIRNLYGETLPGGAELYSSLAGGNDLFKGFYPAPPPVENITCGLNRWLGAWWWFGVVAGIALIWRIVRLFGERRNIMYAYFNCVESGFSGVGVLLLCLGLLLINCGMWYLLLAALSLLFCGSLCKWNGGGVYMAIAGLLLIPFIAQQTMVWHWLLVIAAFQAMCCTGCAPVVKNISVQDERKLYQALYLGGLIAAIIMLAVWNWNIPLWAVWGLLLIARVPGIWQNQHKSVY